MHTFEVIL